MSHAQLVDTIMFLLAWLKVNNPEAYRKAEKAGGLTMKEGKSKRKAPKRKGNNAGLIKAIHANKHMTPAAKRKALATLRAR